MAMQSSAPTGAGASMETYFSEVAALLDRSLEGDEIYLCRLSAERSDFVRLNRGKIRQPGSVQQCYLALRLISGRRHAGQSLTVSGDLKRDSADIAAALVALREAVADAKDDPHLAYATDVRSSRDVRTAEGIASEDIVAGILDSARDLDLVGIYAAGPVYRGFANSLGQRNWHEVTSFNLQWSLYHRADKAVKTSYGGFDWSAQGFASRMDEARSRMALLARPPRTLEPGRYRAYLAPSAMEELAGMVATATYTVIALITGKSLRSTASSTSRPMPGIEKKRSMRNAPISNPGISAITKVMIGIEALRSTCTHMRRFSDTPLARAVRT